MQQPDSPTAEPPRIYVASLSDYNAGRLHGVWIPAAVGIEAIHAAITVMLGDSREPGAEEWAIHDYENFEPVHLGEFENLEHVAQVAEGIVEHGAPFAHYAALLGSSAWEELDRFNERYQGHWASMSAYAEDVLDDLGIDTGSAIPDWLLPYVHLDIDAYARDLTQNLDVSTGDDGVYVFES